MTKELKGNFIRKTRECLNEEKKISYMEIQNTAFPARHSCTKALKRE
jgi:hypothetical protein